MNDKQDLESMTAKNLADYKAQLHTKDAERLDAQAMNVAYEALTSLNPDKIAEAIALLEGSPLLEKEDKA